MARAFVAYSGRRGDWNSGVARVGQEKGPRSCEGGESIRMKGFRTGVAPGAQCASSCALAGLGGVERFLAPTARLGFHAAYRLDGSVAREVGLGNALVGAYLTRIGLPLEAVIFVGPRRPRPTQHIRPSRAAGQSGRMRQV
jgi:hypothetical protein